MSYGTSWVLLVGTALSACSHIGSAQNTEIPKASIALQILEREGSAPGLSFVLTNTGTSRIGITETFLLPKKYFYVEILGPSGRVEYPIAAQRAELFGVEYRCIQPGEHTSLGVISLSSWQPVVSGELRGDPEDPLAFALPPGGYELRVVYYSDEPQQRRRCRTATGPFLSQWKSFSVEADD